MVASWKPLCQRAHLTGAPAPSGHSLPPTHVAPGPLRCPLPSPQAGHFSSDMACSPGTAPKIKKWGMDEESTDRQHRLRPGEAARPPPWSRGAQPAPSLPPAHAFAHACPVEEMAGQGPPRPLWPWHLLQRRPTATCTWLRVAPPGLSQPRHGHRALHGTLRPVGSHAVTRLVLEHRTPQGGNGDSQHRTRNRGLAHQAVLQPWPLLAPRTPHRRP